MSTVLPRLWRAEDGTCTFAAFGDWGFAMHSGHVRIWGAVELAKVERQVAITSVLVDLQRCLIDYLFQEGAEIDCEMEAYDSLVAGLARSVNHRQQLRVSLKQAAAA